MNFLDQLTDNQRTLLVSLPYRVGLFVSQSDESGGDDSDEAEMLALENIVTAYAQEVFGAETVQYVISETVSRKEEWTEWGNNLEYLEDDCRKAIDILAGTVDEKELSAFKNHLIEIGESVAIAFREYGAETPFAEKIRLFVTYMKGKYEARRNGERYKDWELFINISSYERKALLMIADALRVKYI